MSSGVPFLIRDIYVWYSINLCLLACLPVSFMEHSPYREPDRFSASQEIPHILSNPKVHHRNPKCTPPVPILSQLDPVNTPTSHFLKINLNIILPSLRGYIKWSLSLRFPHQNPVCASLLIHTSHMHSPSNFRCYRPNC